MLLIVNVKIGVFSLLDNNAKVLLLCNRNNYCLNHFTTLSTPLELMLEIYYALS